jgi:hypothetical protein
VKATAQIKLNLVKLYTTRGALDAKAVLLFTLGLGLQAPIFSRFPLSVPSVRFRDCRLKRVAVDLLNLLYGRASQCDRSDSHTCNARPVLGNASLADRRT